MLGINLVKGGLSSKKVKKQGDVGYTGIGGSRMGTTLR